MFTYATSQSVIGYAVTAPAPAIQVGSTRAASAPKVSFPTVDPYRIYSTCLVSHTISGMSASHTLVRRERTRSGFLEVINGDVVGGYRLIPDSTRRFGETALALPKFKKSQHLGYRPFTIMVTR